jgi:hypothetical protein
MPQAACPVGVGRPNSVPIYVLARIPPPPAAGYRGACELPASEGPGNPGNRTTWPDLSASGDLRAFGAAWAGPPGPQVPPKNGAGPRVDVDRAAGRIGMLPHRVLAYRGADGFPVVVPMELAGHDAAGLRLVTASGLLPPGGRRAGLLAHAYRPQLVGLATRTFTGWLEVADDGSAVYAPHTSKGFVAPPRKKLLLVSNGLFAKYGLWQARRHGTAERLEQLAAQREHLEAGM